MSQPAQVTGLITAIFLFCSPFGTVEAAPPRCDSTSFGALIDETAQILRTLNKDSERRFQDRLQATAKARGWTAQQAATNAASAMDDARLSQFNNEIEELVSRLDRLSVTPKGEVSCDRLNDLRGVRDRLVTVMGQKSGFILAQVDIENSKPSGSSKPVTETAETSAPPSKPSTPPAPPAQALNSTQDNAQSPTSSAAGSSWRPPSWSTDTKENQQDRKRQPDQNSATATALPIRPVAPPKQSRPDDRVAVAAPAKPPEVPLPPVVVASSGYSVLEIRSAGSGVFGTLTSELAGVINHAFQQYGQPNGYIIGNEGSGAFLAGLRYGEGQLYTRLNGTDTGPLPIFWQGPSLGLDVGGDGSRAIFLVYNLEDVNKLYERYPGIDGSAYVAGGVGLTVFKRHRTLIVPIRTGLGLRVGASFAYLKFTSRASWNPF